VNQYVMEVSNDTSPSEVAKAILRAVGSRGVLRYCCYTFSCRYGQCEIVTGESFFAQQVKVISRLVGRFYGYDSSLARLFWTSLAFVVD
jgi:hypothetical protein